MPDGAPTFYLYGEPQRSAAENFVHAESLDHRSRPAGWTIRPHSHRDLNHVILIARGGGTMQAEGLRTGFEAPCLLMVPAGVVHAFRWHDESAGVVITLANSYRDELIRRDADAARLFAAPAVTSLGRDAAEEVAKQAEILIRELGWSAPGHRTAVETALASVLVPAMRGLATSGGPADKASGRHAALVAHFRALVEEQFRSRRPVAHYAAQLGVSATTLRVACSSAAASSPAEILNARAFLEAKRALRYSNQTVAQIAYSLGFADPAYFTRAFTRHAGCSPRRYRSDRGG